MELRLKRVSPGRVLKGDFNEYMQSVILRVNEAHDVGDFNRFDFHERTEDDDRSAA